MARDNLHTKIISKKGYIETVMFRQNHRHFELEASRAKDGGYTIRISRKGAVVHILGGDEKGQGSFADPDSALEAGVAWIDRNFLKARPQYMSRVS